MHELFRGELVRLTTEDPMTYARVNARWQRDSEYVRLVGGSLDLPSEKRVQEWAEKRIETGPQPEHYPFHIRTLADDRLIGFLSLRVVLIHSDGWVGVGIGDRDSQRVEIPVGLDAMPKRAQPGRERGGQFVDPRGDPAEPGRTVVDRVQRRQHGR